ncbi:MAG: hypothetical protein Kow0077_31450 [Anaerolineae bacterium]
MITLRPMTEAEFRRYLRRAVPDGAHHYLAALLPGGPTTPWQFFCHIRAAGIAEPVGHVWFSVIGRGRGRLVYIYDLAVYPAFRRRGFATQALQRLETWARALDAALIVLHLAEANSGAAALYRKCGYQFDGLWASKDLRPGEAPQEA